MVKKEYCNHNEYKEAIHLHLLVLPIIITWWA